MQTLQQELDPAQHGLTASDHPVLRGLMADPATAYAEEVRVLRQRVALLEAELAATRVASGGASPRQSPPLTSIDFAPDRTPRPRSEFIEQLAPAVSAALPPAPRTPSAVPQQAAPVAMPVVEDVPVPDPGFAQAWTAEPDAASFEERVAERAFFQAASVDEESRSWLLAD